MSNLIELDQCKIVLDDHSDLTEIESLILCLILFTILSVTLSKAFQCRKSNKSCKPFRIRCNNFGCDLLP